MRWKNFSFCIAYGFALLSQRALYAQEADAGTGSEPAEKPIVSAVPFRGSPQYILDDGFAALLEVMADVLPEYTVIPVDMNNLPPDVPPTGQPAYVCPSPSMTNNAPYALSGEVSLGEDGQNHLRLYLWETANQRLIFSDETIISNKDEALDLLPAVLPWIFSWIKEKKETPQVAPEPIVIMANYEDLWRRYPFYFKWGQGLDIGLLFDYYETGQIVKSNLLPTLLGGFEWHFWDYLALEVDPLRLQFLYLDRFIIGMAFPVMIKGTFRPNKFMLEPYVGAEVQIGLNETIPFLSVIAGGQFSLQAGKRSAWTVELRLAMSVPGLGGVPYQGRDDYSLLRISLLGGYKVGIGVIKKKAPPAAKPEPEPAGDAPDSETGGGTDDTAASDEW